MAALLGERVGETVGISTRDERRVSKVTRIEVVTDGILTRRLQRDPTLDGVALVIFDEFHERHLQADLGLALTLDAREGLRPELRVLVMSATLDSGAVSVLLGDAPFVSSRGRSFPIDLQWMPRRPNIRLEHRVAAAVHHALERDPGDVLVFLPGTREIGTAIRTLGGLDGVDVLPLHGTLTAAEQDRALRSGTRRRVVVATDIAESSVTVEGVTVVIDSGLARRPAFDPASGLSRLQTITTSRASADQRAGRAGRTAPGVAYRLWSESEHLGRRAWPDPEIAGADLAPLALELAAWGAPSEALRWLDPPPPGALTVAASLLVELGALADGRPTDLGRRMLELPLHPRLARMVIEAPADDRRAAALLAAMLSERDIARARWAGLPRERGRRGAPRRAHGRRFGHARGRRRGGRNGAPACRRAAPTRQVVCGQQPDGRSRSAARSRLPRPDRAVAGWCPLPVASRLGRSALRARPTDRCRVARRGRDRGSGPRHSCRRSDPSRCGARP